MSDLVERLLKRAKDDQACADNSKVIVDALSEQMRLFESREGHNVYAVRMAVDHKSGMDRDNRYASDLREAASRISQQDAELERMRLEVEEANAKIAKTRDLISWAQSDLIAEARKAAFIEAAEMIEDNMLVDWDGPYREKMIPRSNPGNKLGMAYAAALRRKAEESRT